MALNSFLLAVQFLTRLPVSPAYSEAAMAASPRWYPAAGVLVGAVGALVWGLAPWPPLVSALVTLAVMVAVTGGLHEDGLADTFDGLGGVRPKERAMEIMRDSRIGTYGVLALVVSLGVRGAGFAELQALPFVLVAGAAASRGAMVWAMATSRYARATGAGSAVAGGIDAATVRVAAVTVALALVPLLFVLPLGQVALGLLGLGLGAWAIRAWYQRRLGGYTGDCLGAVQQCAEIGFILGLLA
ncbi:adenosylcobinamide-GDP ribazoletransferase [Stagnihabitans tardus]|uniref:Adenosylcobinamide-GDP ribazoletransferase n=1 Tax=Stagnihabitans tardus TaxID=2699202 RepID=A0AAE4YCS8_9RHOB|nr:adenosylcobinamide-GDP ribazoletransferase [Stagnihabitans tardus]NBZ87255.1 adenosylcobinamide-GDP ribazoletransferase [Stagnihabitans tardus]